MVALGICHVKARMQGRSQLMTKGGSFLIKMGVAYICLYKFVYIKLSERGVL